jgi:hypothetical protein
MSSFHQTAYLNALREIKRLAEIEDFSPTTLVYLIDTEAARALAVAANV